MIENIVTYLPAAISGIALFFSLWVKYTNVIFNSIIDKKINEIRKEINSKIDNIIKNCGDQCKNNEKKLSTFVTNDHCNLILQNSVEFKKDTLKALGDLNIIAARLEERLKKNDH